MTTPLSLPQRQGPAPKTSRRLPHSQLNQHGPDHIVEKLHDWCFALPDVANAHSGISVPGARALVLHEGCDCNHNAFMVGREFAHIHPHPDNGSMHVKLSAQDAQAICDAGWGEDHYLVSQGHYPKGLMMLFSPRNEEELNVITAIVGRSYEFATGRKLAA